MFQIKIFFGMIQKTFDIKKNWLWRSNFGDFLPFLLQVIIYLKNCFVDPFFVKDLNLVDSSKLCLKSEVTLSTIFWPLFCLVNFNYWNWFFLMIDFFMHTAKWIWDRSIFSIIKPSFDIELFQYFWKFTQICKKFAAYERKIVFVIVSGSCTLKIVQKQ